MIIGKDPLLVFTYTLQTPLNLGGLEIPLIPIPIPLEEDFTGLAVKQVSTAFTIDSTSVGGDVKQNGISNNTSIQLEGNKNSLGVNILLPILKTIFAFLNGNDGLLKQVLPYKSHNVMFYYQNHFISEGRISNLSWSEDSSSDRITINLAIDEGNRGSALANLGQGFFETIAGAPNGTPVTLGPAI